MLRSTRLDLITYSINFIKLLISFALNDQMESLYFAQV
jgi:hypothetical protein